MDLSEREASLITDEELLEENLPPGMKFQPTDAEIIEYLQSYNWDKPTLPSYIHQVELSDHHPRDLMRLYGMRRSSECLLISRRNKKYKGGHRPSRDAGNGFYKPTSKDFVILDEDGEPAGGVFKTLAYYEGKCRRSAKKSNWMIKEYRLGEAGENGRDSDSDLDPVTLDGLVLCKLFESARRRRKVNDEMEVEEGGAIEEHAEEEQLNNPEVIDEPNMQAPYCFGTDASQSHKPDWQSRAIVSHSGSFEEASNPEPIENLWRPTMSYLQSKYLPFQFGSNTLNISAPVHGVVTHHGYDAPVPPGMRLVNIVPGCHPQSSVDPMFVFQGSIMASSIDLPIPMQQQQELYMGNVNSFAVNQEGKILDSESSYYQANLLGMAFNRCPENYLDGHSHINTSKAGNSNGIEVHGRSSTEVLRETYFEDNQ